ncbi:hypothetical protein MD484_g8244, partial [Candolleomyces efflorescens]
MEIANVLVMEDFMKRWPITPLQKGIMTAVLELGALIGALSAGILADKYSRRYSIIAACLIFILGSSFQTFAHSLPHLFIGRAIGGLGVGALSMLSPLYMAEISPPELRGSLLALEQLSIVLGVVFGFWTGFVTRNLEGSASWRIPLGVQIGPGVVLALGCLVLPPSPRWLVLRGREGEALRSLAKLRMRPSPRVTADREDEDEDGDGVDELLKIELLEMRVENELIRRRSSAEETSGKKMSGFGSELRAWGRLFSKEYRERTWIGVLIMFFQQWSGINALLYYGPTLVQSIGLEGDTVSLLVSGGIGIVQFLAVLPAILYIDRLGRKPLLRFGSAMMTFAHLSIALLVILFQDDWENHRMAAWVAVGGIYTFTAAYGSSFGPIGWVLPSEVFPLSMRSQGVALSTASNWSNNFLIGLLTPVLITYSPSATFVIFATSCFVAYLWSTYVVPETANVSLEEMDEVFESGVGREDREVKVQVEVDLGLRALVEDLYRDSVDT